MLYELFSAEDVARARRYHRPLYLLLPLDLGLSLGVPAVLAFGPWVFGPLDGLPWWARALLLPALVVLATTLVRLPLAFWRGYVHERAWGFSTQTLAGWAADRAKGLALAVALTAVPLCALVALARALPGAWPAVAAPGAALLVLALVTLAPVALEPLFNRFRPLADEQLAADLRALAARAGVPVRDVLVADASRRTRHTNAYVSGLGRTRRVVVFDTLLERSAPAEIRLLVAHELGHRRYRHVALWAAISMAGAAGLTLALWGLLSWHAVLGAIDASGAGDTRIAPFVLLVVGAAELAGLPLATALSRRCERAADRFSLEVTRDLPAFEAVHRALGVDNLIDLDPPRAVYVLLSTHPTQPERIAAARRWAEAGTVAT